MSHPTARYVLPEFTERTSSGVRTMDPYSKLLQERVIILGTQIDDTSANDVMAQLIHLESAAPEQDVYLYINSPGGSFTAMTAIYDTMRFVMCDVATVCIGQASSAARCCWPPARRGSGWRPRGPDHDPSAVAGRCDPGSDHRPGDPGPGDRQDE